MVEDLLEQAEISRDELAEGRAPLEIALNLEPITLADTLEWDAAQTIKRLAETLEAIAEGEAEDPAEAARAALDAGL